MLTIDHTAPVFVDEPVALTLWRDADPEGVITWKTDDIALGKILVQHTSGAVTELVTESEDTTHTVLVPTEISRCESNTVIVMATNRAGLRRYEPFVVEHRRHSNTTGLRESPHFQPGITAISSTSISWFRKSAKTIVSGLHTILFRFRDRPTEHRRELHVT